MKKKEEENQKDKLIMKLIEKVSSLEKKTFRQSAGHKNYYGEFAYKYPSYHRSHEMDPVYMENMRLRKEIEQLEMMERQEHEANGMQRSEQDELIDLLKKYGAMKK